MLIKNGHRIPLRYQQLLEGPDNINEIYDPAKVLDVLPKVNWPDVGLASKKEHLDNLITPEPFPEEFTTWLRGKDPEGYFPGQVDLADFVYIGSLTDDQPIALHYITDDPAVICLASDGDDTDNLSFWIQVAPSFDEFLTLISR